MAIVQGPNGLRDDEMTQIQDPSLPGPLGLDMNNPMVQQALAKMNVSGFDQQPPQSSDLDINSPNPMSNTTIDKLKLALASAKPVSNPTPEPAPEAPPAPAKTDESKQIDFSQSNPNEKNYAQKLKEAQHKRDVDIALDKMVAGSKKIGYALAGGNSAQFKPDTSAEEEDMKRAGHYITDVEDLKKAESSDPNSSYSKGLRDWAKQTYNIDLKGASAEQVEKIAPYLSKQFEAQQERGLKESLLKEKLEERRLESSEKSKDRSVKLAELAQTTQDKQDAKNAARYDTDFRRLGEKLTEETASSRSVLGKAANISRSADAIETLATQVPDPNNLDTRQIQEIARNLDAMLSSGASTISGTEKLVPHTASGDSAKIAEYIAGIPKGAEQGDFVKRMIDTVKREKELAQKQIGTAKNKITSGYGHLKKADPDRYQEIMKAHGIGDSDSYSDAQERGIQRVMDSNKVSREEAVKALKDAGKL